MLQSMRDMSKSWIFKGLMAFLVISFSIWGIGDIFRGNPQQRAVAKVGKTEISVQELEYEFQRNMKQARQQYGNDFTVQQARQMGLLERTLFLLIERNLFNLATDKEGLVVPPKFVLDQIAAQPHFRDKDGKFNNTLWQSLLRQYEMTEKAFIANESREETRRQIMNSIAANSILPQTIIDNLYKARGQKRILEVVSLPHANIPLPPAPETNVLKQYHEEHADKFTAPEYRGVTIAKLMASDIIKDTKVSDDAIEKAFEERQAELGEPERRDLLQVVVQEEAKAKLISEAARAASNLSQAAKSQDVETVALNQVQQDGSFPEFYGEIFKMKEGEISAPLKSDLGWHVVQVKKIVPAKEAKLADVKEKLRAMMQQEAGIDNLTRIVNQLDDALAAGRPLEEIADSMKLRLIKVPAVDMTGLMPNGKAPAEFPAKEDVLRAAFAQSSGDTSQVLEEKTEQSTNYLVVRTDDVKASQVRPFDEAKADVLNAWQKEARAKKAAAQAETMAKEMRDGKTATSLAAQSGVEVRLSKPISLLGDVDRDVPATVIPQVLKMQKGDVVTASASGLELVLRLAEIVAADPTKPDAGRARVSKDLSESIPLDLVDQYSAYLKQEFPVSVNSELLETLRKQGS